MRRKLAAGNWKMNGLRAPAHEELRRIVDDLPQGNQTDVLICPPATLLAGLAEDFGATGLRFGGQDCHPEASGAHTGDIAAPMLSDAGATHVILGHSERRQNHGESDALIARKVSASWDAGLCAVLCIGETETQHKAGETLDVLRGQIDGSLPDGASADTLIVAYEPVWAIGTGLVPEMEDIAKAHGAIRAALAERLGQAVADGVRLLYGGSVKAGNAAEIFAVPDVDGALVGGASLTAKDFSPIIAALSEAAEA